MNQPSKHPIPGPIARKLDEVRQVLRSYLTKKWLYMLVSWLLLIFWLGAAIDYLPVRVGSDETPRVVRIGMLVIMAAGSLWLLFGWLMPRLLKPISDSSIALLIERQQPELGNRLITAVQVCGANPDVTDQAAHAQMFEKVLEEASQSANSVNTAQLFNWRPLNHYRIVALIGIVATLIVAVASWSWFSRWNARLFGLYNTPWPRSAILRADWLQIPLPTFTGQLSAQQIQIAFENGMARVPAGSSPQLQVSADAAAPKLPEVCTLHYRSNDGTRGRANLRRIGSPRDGWQQFSLDGPPLDTVSAGLSLDIVGLDARLRGLVIDVIEPVVVVDMQLECDYPAYLIDSLSTRPKRELLPYRTGMKIPEGTKCTLVGHCSSMLRQVDYSNSDSALSEPAEVTIQQAQVDQDAFRIPLGELDSSQLVEIRLLDQYGLPSEQVLRYNVTVQIDAVPEVQSRLEGIGLAITPKATLPIRGQVTDDHQIADVAVEMSINESVVPPVPLQLNDTELMGEIDLPKMIGEGKFSLSPGVTLGLSVRARDRYDLAGGQHIGRGQPQQLSVVTEDALLVVLDRQELELRRRLEQIINELQQLDDALNNLSEQLTELDAAAGLNRNSRSAELQAGQLQRSWLDSPFAMLTNAKYQTGDKQAGEKQAGEKQTSDNPANNDPSDDNAAAQQAANQVAQRQALQRLAILRAQQGQLQADKSRQELSGIVNRVEHLRLQLVNNRIDSVDRQQRLLEQVQKPLSELLAGEYTELDRQMSRLQSAVSSGQGKVPALAAAESLGKVLQALEAIKASMLDIESFNEIIDLVRNLLDEQERLLNETEEAQKSKILDIFK